MASTPIGTSIADAERDLILETLAYCKGNRTHSALLLDISLRGLRNKLNGYHRQGFAIPEAKRKEILPSALGLKMPARVKRDDPSCRDLTRAAVHD